MKGIYLTEQGKQEIEAKIVELKLPHAHHDGIYVSDEQLAKIDLLEDILTVAIILPVEENWDYLKENQIMNLEFKHPDGIIIKPKQ